ncbi:MAG TPA: adenylate/guanylate cyclase domain-containing protein [Gaiellaceae bacterium]|nr:adenylate/guanylate cyclase domain-containing protein [Gaiellaceae bacterium]
MATQVSPRPGAANELVPFVPRLTIEWLTDHPERLWIDREGTLAFVDISGFTAMSEKLAALGRAGAEEVTDVMNATFAALLEVAYAHGGGLLKFGGDALLLLFDGPDHARRAAAAAVGMRDALAAIAHPQTSAGDVELRMHVGMHSGRFLFFLVGESHRELLVAGPGATRTVEMEASSEAGEILLSPETAAAIPADCLGDVKGIGRLLVSAPPVEAGLVPLPPPAISLEQAIPRPLRAQLLEVGRFEGEHRNAAIGFVKFSGLDDLLVVRGADGAAAALDAVVRAIQHAADEHQVTFLESDVDKNGGRIILVSGAPQTAGDDETRLVRTLRAALDSANDLPLHIGASRGRVFTGQVGAEFRRTYTVLGDTAALAARLMARAEANELLAAQTVLDRTGGSFEAIALEPFMVKGKSEPVQAFSIHGLASSETAEQPRRTQLPFVDRERERAVLNAAVAPVRLGFGSLVELVGEPGLGKSRLTEELRSYCEEMPMVTSSCQQYEAATPYFPFRPLMRTLLGVELNGSPATNREILAARLAQIDPALPPWAPLLAAPLDVEVESTPEVDELEPSFRRARLHGVVGTLLGKIVDTPTFFLFEDVHWMDEASSELLRFLALQVSTHPWLACTTRRPVPGGFIAAEGVPPAPAMTLRLEPLPEADARKLVEAAAGEAGLSADEAAALIERGAGNPLFLQELAVASGDSGSEELPETVEALLATRIDGLAPGDRTLLRWASVLGASFHYTDLDAVLSDDPSAATDTEVWDRLAEFVERDPAVAGGFRFRHALIRDAAYEGLSFRRRRELHGRVAEMLEERHADDPDEVAELLSLHFSLAGRPAETWRYATAGGRRAREKWANREAVELYMRALDVADDVPGLEPSEVSIVWEAVAQALRRLSEFADAAQALAEARKTARGQHESVRLMGLEGRLRQDWGRYPEAIEWYDQALAAAESLDDVEARRRFRLDFDVGKAWVSFRQGSYAECIARCEEVVAGALPTQDVEALARAYLLLHLTHMLRGSPERDAYRGLALTLYEELGDLRGQADALNNLGIDAYFAGDWVKAADLYARGRALQERIGDAVGAARADNNLAEIYSDQGRLDEARELFTKVIEACELVGYEELASLGRSNLGYVEARAGNLDAAAALLTEAVEEFKAVGTMNFVLETRVRQAEVAALQGNGTRALELADDVLADAGDATEIAGLQSHVQRIRASALLQLGRTDDAGAAIDDSVARAREAGATFQLALSLDLLAEMDGDRDAASESAELLEGLGIQRVARPPFGS